MTELIPGSRNPSWAGSVAHERALWDDIKRAHSDGKRKRAAYLAARYLASYDARLVASREAYRALKPVHRPPFSTLPGVAAKLNGWLGSDERVVVRWKPKASNPNEFRPIMEFGIENRALQYLVAKCIKAQADFHPDQFAVCGGRDAAVKRVREALLSGFRHAAELDIRNCFQSFDEQKLSALLPVPKEVVERVVLSRSLNLYPHRVYFQSCDGPPDESDIVGQYLAEARQGIAQGSAVSSVVAEVLLAPVIDSLPGDSVAVAYADNIMLMAKSRAEAVSMEKALCVALESHPAGPLRLNHPRAYNPGQPVKFLGYTLTTTGTECSVEPSRRHIRRFKARFSAMLKRINTHSPYALRRYVSSWSNAFALWPGAKQHRELHLAIVDAATTEGK